MTDTKTCGLWGCGRPSTQRVTILEWADGKAIVFPKTVAVCAYHHMMLADAEAEEAK